MELLLLMMLLSVCSAQRFNYAGTVTTYYPKYNADGSVTVELRFKLNGQGCRGYPWRCLTGDCGTPLSDNTNSVDYHIGLSFCQLESVWVRQVSTNAPFQTQLLLATTTDEFWRGSIVNGVRDIKALTLVELRNRSDSGRFNRSPQTTVPPVVRVPSNCQRDVHLLTFDPDGDLVRCRYADSSLQPEECAQCSPPSVLRLSPSCSLSFGPTDDSSVGLYAVQLMMEDFPTSNITLTSTGGAQEEKTTSDTISKIPVQFLFSVEAAAPSCSEGLYLPRFVEPTPEHGAQLNAVAGELFEFTVKAEANVSTVSEMLFSGPYNMQERNPERGLYFWGWRPSVDQVGNTYPVCFIAEAVVSSTQFHSELRCVVVNVINVPPTTTASPTPPATTVIQTTPVSDPAPTFDSTITTAVTTNHPSTQEPSTTTAPMSTTPAASPTLNESTPTAKEDFITVRVFMKVQISSSAPLSEDDMKTVLKQFKQELVKQGLPPDMVLSLVSTAPPVGSP